MLPKRTEKLGMADPMIREQRQATLTYFHSGRFSMIILKSDWLGMETTESSSSSFWKNKQLSSKCYHEQINIQDIFIDQFFPFSFTIFPKFGDAVILLVPSNRDSCALSHDKTDIRCIAKFE